MGEAKYIYFTCLKFQPSPFIMAATANGSDVAAKIVALKAAVQDKKVLPKRSTRGQRSSKSSAASSADESLVSNASFQDCETTETYFLWGCELSRKNDSYVLPFPDADSDSAAEMEDHVLTIKSLTLGVDAQEKDRNVVEIRYHDRDDKPTSSVIASLTLGQLDSCRVDLRMTQVGGREVTLKLIKGSGPVSVLGNHVVESLQSLTVDDEYEPDASSAEDVSDASGMETEGDEVEADEIKDLKEDEKKAEEEKAKEEKK